MLISEHEKKVTAYHEAGHALVAKLTPEADPIHKVTIIPRGMALGVTQQLPLEDKYTLSRSYLSSTIKVLLGGRAAEEIAFSERTSGAGNDLERVTEIARKMVCEWGMSETVGPVTFGKGEQQPFLGREISRKNDYSEDTAVQIDSEIRKIVAGSYDEVLELLRNNIDLLHELSALLLEKEVIDSKELDELVSGTRGTTAPPPTETQTPPDAAERV